ncbi:MAG: hypothetical protein AAF492_21005 [Verrucomicrobiota bacterium]
MTEFLKHHWKRLRGHTRVYLLLILATSSLGLILFGSRLLMGADGDQDLMPDSYEDFFGLDASNPADAMLNDDSDLLINLYEAQQVTDPFVEDTDGDGF